MNLCGFKGFSVVANATNIAVERHLDTEQKIPRIRIYQNLAYCILLSGVHELSLSAKFIIGEEQTKCIQ